MTKTIKIRKAVFPVAGFGTRFLPATKAMPKELLPIVDKPLIQYAAEEAIAAGIDTLIFVTGRNKRAIEDHFDANNELESMLRAKGKDAQADMVRNIIPEGVECIFVRHGLNKDLGFTDADRIENIRRVGEVAKLMTDAGLIVITAFISPFRSERQMVRDMMAPGEFVEVFVDTPLSVAEERDVKGLYAKARSGQLKNFTGIDSPYEAPETPEIHIDTTAMSIDDAAEQIVKQLLGE